MELALGDADAAVAHLEQAVRIDEQVLGPDDGDIWRARGDLARATTSADPR